MSLATLLNLLYNLIKSMIDYLWLDKNLELNKYCKTVIDGFSRFHDDLKKTLETEKLPGFNKNLHSLTGQALNENFEELDQHNDSLPEQSRSRVASILSPQPQNIFINSSASSNSPQV